MINLNNMTDSEIQKAGIEVLVKELGIAGMIKFIHYYDKGKGNYTKERQNWLNGTTIDDVVREVKDNKS